MFHNLKGKFQQVQDGISASIRGLKIKDDKSNKSSGYEVNYDAGSEILLQNEENWKEIRSKSDANFQKAEVIDKKISEINVKIKNQLHCIQEINNFFTKLPEFTKKIESVSSDLDFLQKSTAEVEDFLVIFEDIVETEEMKQKEVEERFHFASYIDQRSIETDALKRKLAEQYSEKILEKEKKIQNNLKERQELFNMAFQQDMQLYKESGIVPHARTKETTRTSTVSLEDVVIEDDMNGLNDLLNS